MTRTIEADVLIVGAGGAGLRAAVEAARSNARVVVLSRSMLGKAHTTMAEGGLNAVLGVADPSDSIGSHYSDTIAEGAGLNDPNLVRSLVDEAPERVYDLEEYGAVFDRSQDGAVAQRPFGGQSHPRTCYAGDETGHEMMLALVDEILRRGIETLDETLVTRLLTNHGRCGGCFALDMRSGDYLVLRAGATVIATGGGCGIFQITSNPDDAVGDGYALACEAGAELMDMEQIQFHPTGMTWPESVRGTLVTEAARAEGGVLLNSLGERFMTRYDAARMELAPRDVVTRAIWSEVEAGRGTSHGGVYLDLRSVDPEIVRARLPRTCSQFLTFQGIDITREPVEVAPTAHHFMGGIKVRPEDNRSTTLAGLYVAGEAEAGVHGGNRIGGNALAETQVFGARAGRHAAACARDLEPPIIGSDQVIHEERRLDSMFRDGERPQAIRRAVKELMWSQVGIVRDEEGLRAALEGLGSLKEKTARIGVNGKKRYNPEWHDAIAVPNMLLVSEAVVRSALLRKESRGAHFRTDHPRCDDENWLVNVVVRNGGNGQMDMRTAPVSPAPTKEALDP